MLERVTNQMGQFRGLRFRRSKFYGLRRYSLRDTSHPTRNDSHEITEEGEGYDLLVPLVWEYSQDDYFGGP